MFSINFTDFADYVTKGVYVNIYVMQYILYDVFNSGLHFPALCE